MRTYERRLRLHVLPTLGRVALAALTRADVIRLAEKVTAETSPAAARTALAALSLILGRAVNLGTVPANVAAGVRAPSGERRPPRFLTPAEADRLQTAADAYRWPSIAAFVATALGTGLRSGELMALAWGPGGLDLDARRLTVAATLDPSGVLVAPKNGKARTLTLGAELVARLRIYRLASDRSQGGDRVFRHPRKAFTKVREAAGLPDVRPHDLRHTAATHWLAAGLTVHAVADLLGHADAGLVLTLYGHALPSEVDTAAERMERWRAAQRG